MGGLIVGTCPKDAKVSYLLRIDLDHILQVIAGHCRSFTCYNYIYAPVSNINLHQSTTYNHYIANVIVLACICLGCKPSPNEHRSLSQWRPRPEATEANELQLEAALWWSSCCHGRPSCDWRYGWSAGSIQVVPEVCVILGMHLFILEAMSCAVPIGIC